jgi:spermidine synthase
MSHFPPTHRLAELWESNNSGKPFVYEEGGMLSLCFDIAAVQSRMTPDHPDRLVLGYTRTMMGGLLFNPEPSHILMVGLGGGSLAKYCYRYLPDSQISIVEINRDIIEMRELFAIPADSDRFHVHCGDGADFVANTEKEVDLLMVDGFDAVGQAPSLCTPHFYDDCYRALSEQGILVVNMCGFDPRIESYISRIRRSFNNAVVVVRAENGTNKIVFATKGDGFRYSEKKLLAQARYLEQRHPIALQNIARLLSAQRHNGHTVSQ